MTETETETVSIDAIPKYLDRYGPFAFGVASLLLIWFLIVAPFMESRTLDFDKHREILETQREIASALERTSQTLDNIATRLEKRLPLE